METEITTSPKFLIGRKAIVEQILPSGKKIQMSKDVRVTVKIRLGQLSI